MTAENKKSTLQILQRAFLFVVGDEGLELNESHAAKTALFESGGPHSGPLAPNPETVARFTAELRAAEFTAKQIQAISEAMNAAGVTLVQSTEAAR